MKTNDMMRKPDWDRDRTMTDEEALAYHLYIKPIMHKRATEVIDRHNAAYLSIDADTRLARERTAKSYRKKYDRKKKLRVSESSDLCIDE